MLDTETALVDEFGPFSSFVWRGLAVVRVAAVRVAAVRVAAALLTL